MKKIPTLFVRDEHTKLVTNNITPGCEWVIKGLGYPRRKFDGTACLVRDGKLYRRYELKKGKSAPPDFEDAQEEPDAVTGDTPGWVPVGEGPDDKWHRIAAATWTDSLGQRLEDGKTYELCGPKVQGNPEGLLIHTLMQHGSLAVGDCPRDFDGILEYLSSHDIEGIVWHHSDGRCAKVKKRDYGLRRP